MENLTEPCFVCVTQDICRKRNECVQKDAWADDLELLSPAEGEKKDLGLNSNEQRQSFGVPAQQTFWNENIRFRVTLDISRETTDASYSHICCQSEMAKSGSTLRLRAPRTASGRTADTPV